MNTPESHQNQTNRNQELIRWIEENPDYDHLVKAAKADAAQEQATTSDHQASRSNWQKALNGARQAVAWGVNSFRAHPEDFHGTSIVTPELKKHSQLTANVVTSASIINFISNQSLFLFAFKGLALGLGPIASLAFNFLILRLTNACATSVSSSRKGIKGWSNVAFGGLVLLNVMQSLVAGVGIQLMLNKPALQNKQAEILVDEEFQAQKNRIQELGTPDRKLYKIAQQKCNRLKDISKSHPKYDSIYVQNYGPYAQRNRDWSEVPLGELPYCRQVQRLNDQAGDKQKQAQEKLEQLKQNRRNIDDLQLLKQEYPQVYEQNYNEQGQLVSGTDQVNTAAIYFFENLYKLKFNKIGFSFFFFLLSIVTSLFATWLSLAHAKRQDTQQSRSAQVARERDEWLDELRREMDARHQEEYNQFNSNNDNSGKNE